MSEELNSRVERFGQIVDKVDEWASGDEGTAVDFGGGPVMSPEMLIQKKASEIDESVGDLGAAVLATAVNRAGAENAFNGAVAAASIVGDFRLKVDAVAGMAAQPDNKACTVSADTAANNGYYVKRGGELKRESADTMQAIAQRNFLFEADGEWLLSFQHKVSELLRVLCFSIDRSGETYLRLRSDAEFGPGLLSNRLVPPGVGSLIDVLAGALSVPKGLSIEGSKFEFFSNEEYSLVMLGGADRKAGDLAYGRDGLLKDEVVKRLTARLSPDDLSPAFLARLQSQTSYVAQITGVSPNRRLYVDDAAGTRRLIASTGDPRDAQVLPSGHVMWTDATGQALYAPCIGGATYPVYPTGGASFGDSLTKSDDTNWPGLVGTALGVPWVNAGIGGQASSDIVLRQGGLVPTVAVTGGSIPASGPVVLTMTPTDAWSTAIPGSSFSFSGSIAGVAGTLTHTHTTNVWTFTRAVDGAAVAAPDGTKFVVSTPTYDTRVQTLFFGYNNQYSTGNRYTVIRDYALAVANIKTYVKRYLVFGLVNSAVEPNGSDGLADVLAINAKLAATYGAHYFDYRTWLLNDAMGAAGIAWTANDIADKAAGVVPRSLRIPGPPLDPVHLVPAGYAAIAPKVVALMTNLGWF